jgi:hypothetical protein
MTLENIYYVGQTIAVLAILISLAGLFFQIRQQSRTACSELYLNATSSFSDTFRSIRTDPDFARLYSVALQTWQSLTKAQKLRIHAFNVEMATHLEAILTMRSQSLIEDAKATAWVNNMLGVLITPGGSEWWRESQFFFSPLVREALNQRLANAGTLPPPWTQFPPWDADPADVESICGVSL